MKCEREKLIKRQRKERESERKRKGEKGRAREKIEKRRNKNIELWKKMGDKTTYFFYNSLS